MEVLRPRTLPTCAATPAGVPPPTGRFRPREVRWRPRVFSWMRRLLRSWVQRCKLVKIERQELGIRVELETQDDQGYYKYGFDVFPRKP